jgi:uncharacterized cupredoxin-like copper-binding protein
MRVRRALVTPVAILAATAILAACGDDDDDQASSDGTEPRVIDVEMSDDMTFAPSPITVASGETVTFRFHNGGTVVHEALIGDEDTQMEHGAEMSGSSDTAMAGMDMGTGSGHDAASDTLVTVDPGGTADLTYTFDGPGTLLIGCHEPGHYEAGMMATITIG